MILRVLTSERELLHKRAKSVLLPGALGEMEILPGHAKLVTVLKAGSVIFDSDSGKEKIDILSGFAEVSTGSVIILVEPK